MKKISYATDKKLPNWIEKFVDKIEVIPEFPRVYEPSWGIVLNGRFFGWLKGIKWSYKPKVDEPQSIEFKRTKQFKERIK